MAIPDTSLQISQYDDLGGLVKILSHTVKVGIFTCMPGEVIEWRAPVPAQEKPAFVDVLLHMRFQLQKEDGSVESLEYPTLPNLPVSYPGFSGMYTRGPLDPGEVGLVMFCMRGMDTWKNKGGPLDPVDQLLLDINNGVFIPGVRHGSIAMDIDPNKYVIGAEDGSYKLEVDKETKDMTLTTSGPNIRIESAAEVVVEAPLVKLGANASLGNARLNDPVAPDVGMVLWMSQVATAVNLLAAGSIMPAAPPNFGKISQASTKVLSE